MTRRICRMGILGLGCSDLACTLYTRWCFAGIDLLADEIRHYDLERFIGIYR